MLLVTGVRWSFRGEDAGNLKSQSYWGDGVTRAEPVGRAARPGGTDCISPNPPSARRGSAGG